MNTTRMKLIVAGALALLIVSALAALTAHRLLHTSQVAHGPVVYYCPMHPTYTSDRPGDCPICNMRLVKREAATHGRQPRQLKDICYMHNCPMAKPGQQCPMLVVAKQGEKVTCPICGSHVAEAAQAEHAHKVLYWTDPMIPGYKSDKPGTSPMGMALVPVYEEDSPRGQAASADGRAAVLLTPEKQQLIGVRTAPAQRRTMTKTIRTVGTIAHDPELYQAQQEFIQSRQAWEQASAGAGPDVAEQAKRLLEASRFRLRHLGLSEEMIAEVATWTKPDHRLLLGGEGQYWVYASIYEYELPLVRLGQAVMVEVSALPSRTFAGTVKAIDPVLDAATRTARARIVVDDAEGLLKPGMYVNVSIAVDLGEVVAVPEEAVFSTGQQQLVFVDKGQGLFEPRDVTIGAKGDGFAEIRQGVEPGERVVTSGNFLIDSESRLKSALEGMQPATGSPSSGQESSPTGQAQPPHQHGS